MKLAALLVLWLSAACGLPHASDENAKYRLPVDFLLGAGISSYQNEGAWDADGKGPNVFDYFYHSQNKTPNGDVAADSYHRYEEDIGIAADMGLNVFRFSISWARIFPNGRNNTVNEMGVQHYHNFIDTLIAKKITPMVTILHFDYPQALEDDFNGWLGDEMIDVFAAYADFVFKTYGDKVQHWLTINEPSLYCMTLATGGGMLAPQAFDTPEKQNTCLKNHLLAHAKAYDIYLTKYKTTQKGMIGFGTGPRFFIPANASSAEDVAAAAKANEIDGIALTVDPLVFGDFPESAKVSMNISLTDEQKKSITGRVDFLGINTYGGQTANASSGGGSVDPYGGGGGGGGGGGPGSGGGNRPDGFGDVSSAWVLRVMPMWVKARYEPVKQLPIFITENGIQAAGNTSALDDWDSRAVYCSAFLRELTAGVNENGTRVFGYTLWSFVDTFEFHSFSNWGVVHVDFDDGSLRRTKKDSWTFFKKMMEDRVVPLVEVGSLPFPSSTSPPPSSTSPPPSGSAAFQSSILLAISAILFARWFQ